MPQCSNTWRKVHHNVLPVPMHACGSLAHTRHPSHPFPSNELSCDRRSSTRTSPIITHQPHAAAVSSMTIITPAEHTAAVGSVLSLYQRTSAPPAPNQPQPAPSSGSLCKKAICGCPGCCWLLLQFLLLVLLMTCPQMSPCSCVLPLCGSWRFWCCRT
jgi:hypothetical protein